MGDEAVLTERPQNDKVPKNFLVLNLAPAAEAAPAAAKVQAPAQSQMAAQRRATVASAPL